MPDTTRSRTDDRARRSGRCSAAANSLAASTFAVVPAGGRVSGR